MIGRIDPVYEVAYTAAINSANAFRSPLIPSIDTNALSVDATSLNLPRAVGTTLAEGRFLNAATASQPVCVLGAAAAQAPRHLPHLPWRTDLGRLSTWFYLAGILRHVVLAPGLDDDVLMGFRTAARYLGYTSVYHCHPAIGNPTEIYVRAENDDVGAVHNKARRDGKPRRIPPPSPLANPLDALVAQADAKGAFDGLFLGLGAIALLVGAVGVANIMSHFGARTPLRDRFAPRTRRHQRSDPDAVPRRSPSLLALLGGTCLSIARQARSRPPFTLTLNTGPLSSPPLPGAAESLPQP